MMIRKRSVPHTLEEQISAYAARLKAEAAELPDGSQKDDLLEKIRQLEAASTMNLWLAPSQVEPMSTKAARRGGGT